MKVRAQLVDISDVKKKLVIEIPTDVADAEFRRVSDEYRRYARLPGFRPGKAPMPLVKRRFAGDIKDEVVKALVPKAYQTALEEQSVEPLDSPTLEELKVEEGQAVTFEAHFEVRPRIELPEYKGLEVRVEKKAVTDEDLDAQFEQLREQHAQLVPVEDRPAGAGDHVQIDLTGRYLDPEGNETGEALAEENVVVRVGDEDTHAAFSENVAGMNIGEEKTFEADYPEDYPEKKLAGRRVRFTVEVTDIRRRELPELNDEFAKDLGEFESLEDVRQRIRKDLEAKAEQAHAGEIRKALTNKLIAATSFEVPEVLVEARVKERLEGLAGRIMSQGIDPSRSNIDWRSVREEMRKDTVDEIRGRLILDAVSEAEGFEVSQEELQAEIEQLSQSLEQPVEKVVQYLQKDEGMKGVRENLLRRKALAKVVETAKIV